MRIEGQQLKDKFLENRSVLVTGGGSGIGRAIAIGMADKGAHVFVTGRRHYLLQETADLIIEAGGRCDICPGDVSKEKDVRMMLAMVRDTFGGLDVLVNNAGIFRSGKVHDTSIDDFDQVFGANVRGLFLVSKEAVSLMQGRAGANIINISSISGTRADPGMGIYEASKAAVNTITKVMAKELASFGIRVNAVAPGPVETPMMKETMKANPETAAALSSMVPFGRMGAPAEIARLAVFLASPESDFISGSITSIDGGTGY